MSELHGTDDSPPGDPAAPTPPLTVLAAASPLFADAWRLYEASFPGDNRRTRDEQARVLADPRYRFVAAGDGEVAALYGVWTFPGLLFLEHLAVRPDLRGGGLGGRLLRRLVAGAETAVLEVEPVHDAVGARRLAFYERHGFVCNPYPYQQLPYGPDRRAVPMLLLSRPRPLAPDEFLRLWRRLAEDVYGHVGPLPGPATAVPVPPPRAGRAE